MRPILFFHDLTPLRHTAHKASWLNWTFTPSVVTWNENATALWASAILHTEQVSAMKHHSGGFRSAVPLFRTVRYSGGTMQCSTITINLILTNLTLSLNLTVPIILSLTPTAPLVTKKAFAAASLGLWNSLPPHLRDADLPYSRFQWSLKTFLFG